MLSSCPRSYSNNSLSRHSMNREWLKNCRTTTKQHNSYWTDNAVDVVTEQVIIVSWKKESFRKIRKRRRKEKWRRVHSWLWTLLSVIIIGMDSFSIQVGDGCLHETRILNPKQYHPWNWTSFARNCTLLLVFQVLKPFLDCCCSWPEEMTLLHSSRPRVLRVSDHKTETCNSLLLLPMPKIEIGMHSCCFRLSRLHAMERVSEWVVIFGCRRRWPIFVKSFLSLVRETRSSLLSSEISCKSRLVSHDLEMLL